MQSQVVVEKNNELWKIILKKTKETCVGPIMALHNSLTIFDPRKIVQHLKWTLKQCKDFGLNLKKDNKMTLNILVYLFPLHLKNYWVFGLWKEKMLNMKWNKWQSIKILQGYTQVQLDFSWKLIDPYYNHCYFHIKQLPIFLHINTPINSLFKKKSNFYHTTPIDILEHIPKTHEKCFK